MAEPAVQMDASPAAQAAREPLLEVERLKTYFPVQYMAAVLMSCILC